MANCTKLTPQKHTKRIKGFIQSARSALRQGADQFAGQGNKANQFKKLSFAVSDGPRKK